jgi:hypothetical protein
MLPLDDFARAGGGGSSSGGGGSAGGGGSGGGESIYFILGYLPMHGVGAVLARLSKKGAAAAVAANIVGWIIALIYAWFWTSILGALGFFVGIAALVGIAAGLYGWFGKIRQSPLMKGRLQAAAEQDSAWDEAKLVEYAHATFLRYQQDWSKLDDEAMKAYLTPSYQRHASLLVNILRTMKRRDLMTDVEVANVVITNMTDEADNSQDRFTAGFSAHAKDQLIETTEGSEEELFTDTSSFTEYWHFVRHENTWLVDGITQSTQNPLAIDNSLVSLAMKHNYCYSEDMGWLFIPKRGQLFNGAKFGSSDINNHIVGMYDNRLLTQVYSYIKDPAAHTKPYVIAQVSVPRHYGNIVVRRKKMLQLGIRGLERVETEWTKFNNKYEVFASNYEQATSFELLNPTYMEQLEALGFEVNIEVVDNVVYLYTDERGTDVATYETMLDLLDKAFKEMRL